MRVFHVPNLELDRSEEVRVIEWNPIDTLVERYDKYEERWISTLVRTAHLLTEDQVNALLNKS